MSSDDIVIRLRRITAKPLGLVLDPPPHPLCKDAADEIVRLQAKIKRLKAELFAERNDAYLHDYDDGSWRLIGDDGLTLDWYEPEN
jgi:hypothetical protein